MQKRAFVVEDDENIREVIRCTLESCGLEVSGFEDANFMFASLAVLPDIILLDLMLPGMNGLDALKKLKSEARTARIPVLILTAKSSETDKVAGLDLGADDYITKPFGVLELMARVRASLRRASSGPAAQTAYTAGPLKLDSACREVTLNGQKIDLTLKEFDLLRLLMENADRVLPRDEILDEVWGYGYAGESRTLDMHVRSLRQKLGCSAADGGFIRTVRGVGYRFVS
jgi:two-component system alkaline phosphatase synthesis response regulator PhoP